MWEGALEAPQETRGRCRCEAIRHFSGASLAVSTTMTFMRKSDLQSMFWLVEALVILSAVCAVGCSLCAAQQATQPATAPVTQSPPQPAAPPASGARILLLPRQIVSGERATLAVLDVNGRLTPGVDVTFSNGDRLKTDATGRALFVAPLTPGVIFGSITGRAGRVSSVVLSPKEAEAAGLEVTSVPRVASITDRFDVYGHGFCGDADANQVSIGGQRALVLAASPMSLVVLPPSEAEPGAASVEISCGKRVGAPFVITFVELALEADASPLAHAERRALRVTVRGSTAKLPLEARNLSPDIADLAGGNPAKQLSSGGADNAAKFEVVGKRKGSFLISIRLVASNFHPTATVP
jgi:hypothetical protein